jgi:hypothetical protein
VQNALTLASGFLECLLLALAIDAVRRGRRMYAGAVLGLAMLLYGRMADGFISSTAQRLVVVGGLVLAGLTVGADMLFEVVQEPGHEPAPESAHGLSRGPSEEPGEKPGPSV